MAQYTVMSIGYFLADLAFPDCFNPDDTIHGFRRDVPEGNRLDWYEQIQPRDHRDKPRRYLRSTWKGRSWLEWL